MRSRSHCFRLAVAGFWFGIVCSANASAICNGHYGLKINEFAANPEGSDSSALAEWVEIYNVGGSPVNLAGWTVERAKSSSSDWSAKASLSGILNPGEMFTVGEANAPGIIDMRLGSSEKLDLGNAGSNADGVRLVCADSVADTVIYGTQNIGEDDWQDDSGMVAYDDELAPKPVEGGSLARSVDGEDSDDSGKDFCGDESPTPGEENDCGEITDTGDTGQTADCEGDVVVNELLTDPEGSDGGYEWVELYNADSVPVPLNGWVLQAGKSNWLDQVDLFGILPAGAFLLIGEENVSGSVDIEASLDFGNASSSADGVRLVCGNGVADTVLYGNPNSDEFRDDGGGVATSLAEVARGGQCLARIQNGYDTNLCGLDLAVLEPEYCSPGGPNPSVEPAVCDTEHAGAIKLNEVFANPDGSDGGYEWIELVNTGGDSQRLDAWQVDVGKSSWGTVVFEFPNGATLQPGEYLVVGGPDVESADYQSESNLSMGNAGSNADGVRLVDCEGVVADTLVYGPVNGDGLVDDSGNIATTLAPSPEDDMSLSRWPDGADSDDGSVDWRSCMYPSPGEENNDCQSGSGDTGSQPDPGAIGCGCRSDDDLPDSDVPGEGCTSAPIRKAPWWMFGAVVVVCRRRRQPVS